MLFQSSGIINCRPNHLFLEIDPEITRYYLKLLPNSFLLGKQKYKPHITISRNDNLDYKFNLFLGKSIKFEYSNVIRHGKIYYFIDCFSIELEDIRTQLNLKNYSPYILPPKNYLHTFHTTLGNLKPRISTG